MSERVCIITLSLRRITFCRTPLSAPVVTTRHVHPSNSDLLAPWLYRKMRPLKLRPTQFSSEQTFPCNRRMPECLMVPRSYWGPLHHYVTTPTTHQRTRRLVLRPSRHCSGWLPTLQLLTARTFWLVKISSTSWHTNNPQKFIDGIGRSDRFDKYSPGEVSLNATDPPIAHSWVGPPSQIGVFVSVVPWSSAIKTV